MASEPKCRKNDWTGKIECPGLLRCVPIVLYGVYPIRCRQYPAESIGRGTTKVKCLPTIAILFSIGRLASSQTASPRIYVEPQEGFESYLSAAIVKKHVPAVVTQDKENASFVLTSAVLAKEESTGSKVARCLFAYCAGIQGTQTATVQLVNVKTKEVAWAYNVKKGSASAYQSTAEAAAKHLKKFLEEHPQ